MEKLTESEVCFELRNVRKTYEKRPSGGEQPKPALCVDSLRIYKGQATAILGYSGSGKTTLLNLLGLLDVPDDDAAPGNGGDKTGEARGQTGDGESRDASTEAAERRRTEDNARWEIRFGDQPYSAIRRDEASRNQLRGTRFGFVFQDFHLLEHFSAARDISLPLGLRGIPWGSCRERAEGLLSDVSMKEKAASIPSELSGGEKQRVAVMRAISHNPEVVFADEPTGNLDADTGAGVMARLSAWQKSTGHTVVLVSHNIPQAYDFSDRFIVLKDGQVIFRAVKRAHEETADSAEQVIDSADELMRVLTYHSDRSEDAGQGADRDEGGSVVEPATTGERARKIGLLARYVLSYAVSDLLPTRIAREFLWPSLIATLKRWLTTALNVFTLAALIMAALVIGGLREGTVRLLREHIEQNPLALVVEIHGGLGASVKTITEEDEARIRTFALRDGAVVPEPGKGEAERVVYRAAGWNDYALWFLKKDGSRDTDFTPGRTVQLDDPILKKLTFTNQESGPPPRGGLAPPRSGGPPSVTLFSSEEAPEAIVTRDLLKQLGYDSVPEALRVDYQQKAAPLRIAAVAEWIPSGDFLITEKFYRAFRDKQWNWPPRHRHAYLGPLTPQQSSTITSKARSYLRDQRVEAASVERAGTARWLRFRLEAGKSWDEEYWRETFFSAVALYLDSASWLGKLSTDFDGPLPSKDEAWSSVDIGYTRASVYVRELSYVPGVVEALKKGGFGVDDRIAQEVVFLEQVSSFARRLFLCVIGALTLMAVVSIGLSFAQTTRRKQAQIGILRAYGASRRFVFLIYLCEATVIWILGAAFGTISAAAFGSSIGRSLMEAWQVKSQQGGGPEGLAAQFYQLTPTLLSATYILSLSACLLATAIVAFFAANQDPAKSLRPGHM